MPLELIQYDNYGGAEYSGITFGASASGVSIHCLTGQLTNAYTSTVPLDISLLGLENINPQIEYNNMLVLDCAGYYTTSDGATVRKVMKSFVINFTGNTSVVPTIQDHSGIIVYSRYETSASYPAGTGSNTGSFRVAVVSNALTLRIFNTSSPAVGSTTSFNVRMTSLSS